MGFSATAKNGDTVLPSAIGPTAFFNAEGRYLVHKDQPMETAYRTVDWHWNEWHGPYQVERSDFRDVPFKRFPRTFVSPPALELTLTTDSNGHRVVRTPVIHNWRQNEATLVHSINLILEACGTCSFYDGNMKQFIQVPIRRLNWKVLPQGQRPWAQLKHDVEVVLKQLSVGNRPVVEHRLETINAHNPDFAAVGKAGFHGYIILGFREHHIYVLESLYYGNATYVFGERWEELSKKTKAEILNQKLQNARFIHQSGWEEKINALLGRLREPAKNK